MRKRSALQSTSRRMFAEVLSNTPSTTLVLGSGKRPVPGAINHDHSKHGPHIDVVWNLDELPWPPSDRTLDRIIALDVFEHLKLDVIDWVRECWRILKPGGEVVLRVSAWDNPVSYRDPTHHRVFHEETFNYFDPRHPLYREYGQMYFDLDDGTKCPTFNIVQVSRGNADPRWPDRGDICVVMRKVVAE